MSDYLENPWLYLPHFTSAMRFDDMDSDATLNLFTYALDPSRNYADLNARVDSFAAKADIIAFQHAQGIDLGKMLASIPNLAVFQDRSTGLALAVRESPNRSFRLLPNAPGLAGVLSIRGYKPLTILSSVAEYGERFAFWAREQPTSVAIGGDYDGSIGGLQGGILEGKDRWYVSKEIQLQRRWLGALTPSGTRPVAVKIALPHSPKTAPGSVPGTSETGPGAATPSKKHDKDDTMKIMSINFHVGIGVNEEFFALVDKVNPAVILGQEAEPDGFARLRHRLGKQYHISPSLALSVGREAGQTPVLMRKDVFPTVVAMGNRLVSGWKGGGEHGRLWPTRYATWMACKHESGKLVKARSFHAWVKGPPDVMAGRRKQFTSFADWCKAGDRVIAGGDLNASPEQILKEYMTGVNMKLSAASTPDAIFTRGLAVLGHEELANPSHEGSHRVLLLRVSV